MFDFDNCPPTNPDLLRRLQEAAKAHRASAPSPAISIDSPPPKSGEAPVGMIWVCGACGKRKVNKYDFSGSWDESCALHAELVTMKEFKYEGYWRNSSHPELPEPKAYSLPWDRKDEFVQQLKEVQATLTPDAYRGISICRICQKANGNEEYFLNRWRWPSGFLHYVEEHNVIPTGEFARMIQEAHKNANLNR